MKTVRVSQKANVKQNRIRGNSSCISSTKNLMGLQKYFFFQGLISHKADCTLAQTEPLVKGVRMCLHPSGQVTYLQSNQHFFCHLLFKEKRTCLHFIAHCWSVSWVFFKNDFSHYGKFYWNSLFLHK